MTGDPWVLVAGGFHSKGGMDRANLALAEFLTSQGTRVHLVTHSVEEDLNTNPLVTIHLVKRPLGSYALGRPLLDFRARQVAHRISSMAPGARVLVNGANCLWPDMNWAHYVHHAWEPDLRGATAIQRAVKRLFHSVELRREKTAYQSARLIFSNSDLTRRHLIEMLGIAKNRVITVYLGCDPDWQPPNSEERKQARQDLAIADSRFIAAFVGALSRDNRKGLDVLVAAWQLLCTDPEWDVDLLVAGGGPALPAWQTRLSDLGLVKRIRLLGFRSDVRRILASSDVLVSPVRYEAYGLNVQEAICCGLPAIVSASAGVAERYSGTLRDLLLPDAQDVNALADRLRLWRANVELWRQRFLPLGVQLRAQTWRRMAAEMVGLAVQSDAQRRATESSV
jgi:glycosyltransferase involved in cell wall biosynthesis